MTEFRKPQDESYAKSRPPSQDMNPKPPECKPVGQAGQETGHL